MFTKIYLKLFVLLTVCIGVGSICAMDPGSRKPLGSLRHVVSVVNVREIKNNSPESVYVHYTASNGRRTAFALSPGVSWQGLIVINDQPLLAFVEPRSQSMSHVRVSNTPPVIVLPRGVPVVPSEPNLTSLEITENYTITRTKPVNADALREGVKLTITREAFSPIKPEAASGFLVERMVPVKPVFEKPAIDKK